MPKAIPLKYKLLLPGWAGHLAPDELEVVQEELFSDKVLAFRWGFRPSAKRRAEEAIHQIAMHGAPDGRTHNLKLVRGATSGSPPPDVEGPVSDTAMESPEPESAGRDSKERPGSTQAETELVSPYQLSLFAGV